MSEGAIMLIQIFCSGDKDANSDRSLYRCADNSVGNGATEPIPGYGARERQAGPLQERQKAATAGERRNPG
jgi:hypothetical protein